jgi:hypothetical protein
VFDCQNICLILSLIQLTNYSNTQTCKLWPITLKLYWSISFELIMLKYFIFSSRENQLVKDVVNLQEGGHKVTLNDCNLNVNATGFIQACKKPKLVWEFVDGKKILTYKSLIFLHVHVCNWMCLQHTLPWEGKHIYIFWFGFVT